MVSNAQNKSKRRQNMLFFPLSCDAHGDCDASCIRETLSPSDCSVLFAFFLLFLLRREWGNARGSSSSSKSKILAMNTTDVSSTIIFVRAFFVVVVKWITHTETVLWRTIFDRIIVFYWNLGPSYDAVYLLAVTLDTSNKNATRIVQVSKHGVHTKWKKNAKEKQRKIHSHSTLRNLIKNGINFHGMKSKWEQASNETSWYEQYNRNRHLRNTSMLR